MREREQQPLGRRPLEGGEGLRSPRGRGAQIRTGDPLLPKQVRYQAALRPDRRGGSLESSKRRPRGQETAHLLTAISELLLAGTVTVPPSPGSWANGGTRPGRAHVVRPKRPTRGT